MNQTNKHYLSLMYYVPYAMYSMLTLIINYESSIMNKGKRKKNFRSSAVPESIHPRVPACYRSRLFSRTPACLEPTSP